MIYNQNIIKISTSIRKRRHDIAWRDMNKMLNASFLVPVVAHPGHSVDLSLTFRTEVRQ